MSIKKISSVFTDIGEFLQGSSTPNPYPIPSSILITQDYQQLKEGPNDGIEIRLSAVTDKFLIWANNPITKTSESSNLQVQPSSVKETTIQFRVLATGDNENQSSATDLARTLPMILAQPLAFHFFAARGFSFKNPSLINIEYFQDQRNQNRRGHIIQFPIALVDSLDNSSISGIDLLNFAASPYNQS